MERKKQKKMMNKEGLKIKKILSINTAQKTVRESVFFILKKTKSKSEVKCSPARSEVRENE